MSGRDYKFRGKRKDNGEWVYGYYLFSDERHYIVNCCGVTSSALVLADDIGDLPGYNEVIPATVGQFTGRFDDEGKEIYPDDIMEFYDACVPKGRNPYRRVVVEWNKKSLCWQNCWRGKIIGNVVDHPELLPQNISATDKL